MVEATGSTVGEMTIKASMNDTMLQQGFSRVKQGFENIKGLSKGVVSSFRRLGSVVADIAKKLMIIGGAGVASLLGLATASPALAGSLAKIKLELFKLGNIIGKYVRPLFDALANDLLPSLINFVENNKGWIETMFGGAAETIGDLSSLISGEWDEIKNLGPKSTAALAMGSAGYFAGGPIAGFLGAAIGWSIASAVTKDDKNLSDGVKKEISKLDKIITAGIPLSMAYVGWQIGGPMGAFAGFALGGAIRAAMLSPEPETYKIGEKGEIPKNDIFLGGPVKLITWINEQLNLNDLQLALVDGGKKSA